MKFLAGHLKVEMKLYYNNYNLSLFLRPNKLSQMLDCLHDDAAGTLGSGLPPSKLLFTHDGGHLWFLFESL
jgi:hypothetical protein